MDWFETLQRCIGGQIIDWDAPHLPSIVTGFSLTPSEVLIRTEAGWNFGGQRKYVSIVAYDEGVRVTGPMGLLNATIRFPAAALGQDKEGRP